RYGRPAAVTIAGATAGPRTARVPARDASGGNRWQQSLRFGAAHRRVVPEGEWHPGYVRRGEYTDEFVAGGGSGDPANVGRGFAQYSKTRSRDARSGGARTHRSGSGDLGGR